MLTLYGIPTCNSCKKAMKWLNEQNISFTWINTRETPPSKEQITNWIASIGNKSLRNTSGGSYRNLPVDKKDWNDVQWAEAFSKDAMLLKRPLIEKDGVALCTGFRNSDILQSYLDM